MPYTTMHYAPYITRYKLHHTVHIMMYNEASHTLHHALHIIPYTLRQGRRSRDILGYAALNSAA